MSGALAPVSLWLSGLGMKRLGLCPPRGNKGPKVHRNHPVSGTISRGGEGPVPQRSPGGCPAQYDMEVRGWGQLEE
jgi:hypothetical protein